MLIPRDPPTSTLTQQKITAHPQWKLTVLKPHPCSRSFSFYSSRISQKPENITEESLRYEGQKPKPTQVKELVGDKDKSQRRKSWMKLKLIFLES